MFLTLVTLLSESRVEINESYLPEKQSSVLRDPQSILVLNQGQGTQRSI